MAGDETVVTKAGKQTHGLDRFFSSLYGKPIPGLAFFAISLVSVQERKSYPLLAEQRVRSEEEKEEARKKTKQKKTKSKKKGKGKGKRGRPTGSKNKDKTQVEWTPELLFVQGLLQKVMKLIADFCPVSYLVLDGHFGNNNALQMVLQSTSLHLISKLRNNAALYFVYDGPQKKYGKRRRYGAKIDYQAIPSKYRKSIEQEGNIQTEIYQAIMLHKYFAAPLNVVIIVKTNSVSGARAHVVLFSDDLKLYYDKLIDYYRLRFQIRIQLQRRQTVLGAGRFYERQGDPDRQCRQSFALYGQPFGIQRSKPSLDLERLVFRTLNYLFL